ncbi:type IVB secretion system protein IcmH/DotU [Marinobacter sp.]|jgi:type VI secretion system protein ImpK|uniref:type IVB secretion system protein IcmH/DotU n=1 Tax=Marinobacter sp. TaxID=50741 RepID=UPI000C0D40FF|nr:type IVB secretion system protein IcmH/DotU [Marinobacter sp.]MAA87642.1 type IV secretion protein DotU [Haliea sp.]MBE96830.1 type IV secretion protein DotU [Marinobacter sp.]MBP55271.1 type IV secretion protein DotU [Marinobacter sp.]PHQ74633.1 MAG: type IV secretion protein DotU [Marinobacter sp.]|tara:strand:+ start:50 stop:877 length:828 start_codon:yes stop_codon:yes gene_type:complete
MADAPVMDSPNGSTEAGGSAFDDLMFADSNRDGRVGDQGFGNDQFQLRGLEDNRLIDAATPLLGLVIRVRRLADFQGVENLYQQVVDEVAAIDRELVEQGYERPTVVAYRYVLCAFIDEAVLGTDWGAHSVWSQHSLLSRFHNETWGGEKVFAITARMEQEPERYRDMLEFIYLCLCLGFEGRYKVMTNGRDEYEQIIRGLYEQIRGLRRDEELQPLSSALDNVTPARNRLRTGLPLWGIGGLFVAAMAGVYTLYNIALNERIRDVLSVLEQLPK